MGNADLLARVRGILEVLFDLAHLAGLFDHVPRAGQGPDFATHGPRQVGVCREGLVLQVIGVPDFEMF